MRNFILIVALFLCVSCKEKQAEQPEVVDGSEYSKKCLLPCCLEFRCLVFCDEKQNTKRFYFKFLC